MTILTSKYETNKGASNKRRWSRNTNLSITNRRILVELVPFSGRGKNFYADDADGPMRFEMPYSFGVKIINGIEILSVYPMACQ